MYCPLESEVLAYVCKFAVVVGFMMEIIARTRGCHLACGQGRLQAPFSLISGSWHFLTCITSSVPLLWLEAHPVQMKGFPLPSSNCYLCCQLKLFTWFALGDESKPWPIHISHHVHVNWCFTTQELPKEAQIWSLNNFTTNTFRPLPFPSLS